MAIALAKQDIAFFFGGVQQSKSKRGLRPGELIEAINVRQIVEDEYRKRPGFDRVVPTPDSGSFVANGESFVADGVRLLARDGADTVFARSGSTLLNRGTSKRALPKVYTGQPVENAKRPLTVTVGSNYWVFTKSTTTVSFTIFDIATGAIVGGPITFTPTSGAGALRGIAAEYDGSTYVWVLATFTGDTNVQSLRFTAASPSTAPTVTPVYLAFGITAQGVDMHRLASGAIAVAILGSQAASPIGASLNVSYLNVATGTATAGSVTTNLAGVGGGNAGQGHPSIFLSNGSNGNWYVTFVMGRTGLAGGGAGAAVVLATVVVATLATTAIALGAIADNAADVRGFAVGYLAANGDRVVFAGGLQGTSTGPFASVLTRYTYNGATTSTSIRRYSYPVSKPQVVGSSWYLLTGYEDGTAFAFSRSYFLIDSDGNIVTQIGYGQASAPGLIATDTGATVARESWTTPLRVSGNSLDCSLLINIGGGSSSANDFAPALTKIDVANAWTAPARIRDGVAAWPNGTPIRAGSQDNQRELVPMLSPVNATFTAGAGVPLAGPTVIQYVYRLLDADGTRYQTAPSPAQTQTFNNGGGCQVTVKPLTHMLPNTTAWIELYLSAVSSTEPILHTVIANDTTVDTITVTVTPSTIPTAETLYTFGGGLDNAPLPSGRFVSLWRNRVIVGSGSEIWPSLELEIGVGPRFNESLVTEWADGEGDIIAGAPVDWNYFALFKRNAIAVISGSGPNATVGGGVNGNYEPQTLRVRKGDINPRSILTGPMGCYFQSRADGRIYCVTPSAEVVDVSQGMESYRAMDVTATNWVERDRQLHFFLEDGAIMVLDYAHPTPEQPAGRWSRWATSALLVACGAAVDTDGTPVHLETTGAIRTPGAGWTDATATTPAEVLMALTTGDLAASGQLKGAFRIDAVHVLGEWLATNTSRVTVTSDYGSTATTHTSASITASPQELYIRPAGHARAQSARLKIEETSSAGEGFVFTGVSLTVQMHGRAKFPSNSRRVS